MTNWLISHLRSKACSLGRVGGSINDEDYKQRLENKFQGYLVESLIPSISSRHLRLATTAVALATYGRVDALEIAIQSIPQFEPDIEPSTSKRLFTEEILLLIELPEKLIDEHYVRKNKQELITWFYENQEYLVWDDTNGRFEIRS